MKTRKAKSPPHRPAAVGGKVETGNSERETVLLAVTGMSPAVLTETVWALAEKSPSLIPDRIVVVTTADGREQIQKDLFKPSPEFDGVCVWDSLHQALTAAGHDLTGRLRFGVTGDDIRVFTSVDSKTGRSRELSDIRTPADNSAAADFLLRQVRELVETPDSCLVASIAGGRKTMGALLYACLTLIGREYDLLTHVLVNEPFEDSRLNPRFYFPKQPVQHLIVGKDGARVTAADARIELADVPFVPLRNLFERDLVKKPSTFTGLVERCRQRMADIVRRDLRLTLWRSRAEMQVNTARVKLSPLQHVLMLFLAEAAMTGRSPLGKYIEAIEPLREYGEKLFATQRKDDFSDWRSAARLPKDFDDQRLRKLRDELIDKLEAAGPEAAALTGLLPEKGRFSLDLPASSIALRD